MTNRSAAQLRALLDRMDGQIAAQARAQQENREILVSLNDVVFVGSKISPALTAAAAAAAATIAGLERDRDTLIADRDRLQKEIAEIKASGVLGPGLKGWVAIGLTAGTAVAAFLQALGLLPKAAATMIGAP